MPIYEAICMLTLPFHVIAIYLLCNAFMPKKRYSGKVEVISYISYATCVSIIFLLIRIPIVVLLANIILIFLISFNYSYPSITRFLNTVIVYIILMIAEIIPLGMVGFFHINPFQGTQFDSIVGIILVRIVTFVMAISVYRFMKRRKKEYRIPKLYYVIHIFILLGTLYLFVVSLNAENLTLLQMIMSSVILMLVNGLILYTDEKLYCAMVVYTQENTLHLQALAYEKQNETMRQSLSIIRSLKHDMKNHLITLKAMYENQSLEGVHSYISKMMEEMEGTTNTLDSGNFVVDSIVNFKLQEMRMLDVNIQLNVKIPSEMNILSYYLTIVLGNLLDNALTALKQVPSKQQKDFLLHMQYNKGSLIIFMDNTYSHPLYIEDETYKTTKPEKSKHGLGISNVKNVISKYDGKLEIEHTDSKFSVSALIPFVK